jgi:hypothetical protein
MSGSDHGVAVSADGEAQWSRRRDLVFGLAAAVYAVYLCLVIVNALVSYARDQSPVYPGPGWRAIYLFTYQSNIAVLVWLVLFATSTLGAGPTARRLARVAQSRAVMTVLATYMTLVFIVVVTMLYPFYAGRFQPVPVGGGLFVHVASPILVFAVYLLYPSRGRATWRTVLVSLSYLLAYAVVANVVGATKRWPDGTLAYPYAFLDPHGYPNVVVYLVVIIVLAAAVFGIGLALLAAKRHFDAAWGR